MTDTTPTEQRQLAERAREVRIMDADELTRFEELTDG